MTKKILIALFLLSSSLALSLPHKNKSSLSAQLLTKRPTQQDMLLYVDDDIAVNLSQIGYLLLSGYTSYHLAVEIRDAYVFCNWYDVLHEITVNDPISWSFFSLLLVTSVYKVFNAEHIMPIIIEEES